MKWRWNRTQVGAQFQCPGYTDQHRMCGRLFDTVRGLKQHQKLTGHEQPYFTYAKHIGKDAVTCVVCDFTPGRTVDNPRKSLTDHTRRQHRLEYIRNRRPYIITEEP